MPRTIKRAIPAPDDTPDATTLLQWVREFSGLDGQIKALTKRKTEIRDRLSGVVEEHGEEDDKGHIWLNLNSEVEGIGSLKRERRVGQSMDEDRVERILAEKGLTERCMKQVPTLDEDEVMAAHFEGLISEAEIDSMFPKKVSYAFVPVRAT